MSPRGGRRTPGPHLLFTCFRPPSPSLCMVILWLSPRALPRLEEPAQPLKRGSLSPPLHTIMPFMGCLFGFAKALQNDEIDRERALRGTPA